MLKILKISLFLLAFLVSFGSIKAETMHMPMQLPLIEHIFLQVASDMYKKEVDFYKASLAVAGITVTMEDANTTAFGRNGSVEFVVVRAGISLGGNPVRMATAPTHFAFKGMDAKTVDEWYKAALKAGGKDNGKPGTREAHGPQYYGGFVISPAGHNTEMVSVSGPMMTKPMKK